MIVMDATLTFSNGTTYQMSYNNTKSIETKFIDRKDIAFPCFGVISNSGSISIIDSDGTIKRLGETNELKKQAAISISLRNTKTSTSNLVCEMFVRNWGYDDDSKIANAELTDGLEKMQDITIVPLNKDAKTGGHKTGEEIYAFLQSQTVSNGFDMATFDELDEQTKTHISKFLFKFAYIDSKSLWRAWEDFCIATQTYVFKQRDGKIVCVYKDGK